jgi:murein DD-endopeptidase MepM/ murein hydrolase activator NlpD
VTQTVHNPAGHGGVDIGTIDKSNVNVVALTHGPVTEVCDGAGDFQQNTPCSINGNFVRIHYDIQGHGGVIFQYGHLLAGSLAVKKGDIVKEGQLLGKMGQSGWATGVHTHFHMFNEDFTNSDLDFRTVFNLNGYKSCNGRKRGSRKGRRVGHD